MTLVAARAPARVVRVEILRRADLAGGRSFGLAGAYETVVGRMHFAVRPEDPRDAAIVDLALAPKNAAGEVEFSADVVVVQPKDPARGSGTLLLEIPNRGGRSALALLDRGRSSEQAGSDAEIGDAFLLRRGASVAWVGWQWDVRPGENRLRLEAPVARGSGGSIRGLVRADFVVDEPSPSHPLGHLIVGAIGGTSYAAAAPDSRENVLTEREGALAPRKVIPRGRWRFAHDDGGGKPVPDDRSLWLQGGFRPGRIYEVVYVAQDPAVAGLGFAAVRDAASYFKHAPDAVAPARRVYGFGISQSGRFLRHFLKQGFNADEQGRQVFDGLFVHVAGAGVGSFNHRFAQPSRDAQPLSPLFYPTDLFPFAFESETDPETGETAGLLDRARADRVVPRVFATNTSYEYWGRAASLVTTTSDGKKDAEVPDEVRVYLLAGLQHFSGPFPPTTEPYRGLRATHPQNPNPVVWVLRALFDDMEAWVREGTAPPESRYPRLADGTLIPRAALRFPRGPGLEPPERLQEAYRIDFGPKWKEGVVSREPPAVSKPFPVFVPRADADGNDVSGIRLPEMEVPVATTTGWNLRDPATGFVGERVSFIGSYVPFPATAADRARTLDQRQSLEERYGSKERYLGMYGEAALKQVTDRFLLPEDLPDVLRRGAAEWDAAAGPPGSPHE